MTDQTTNIARLNMEPSVRNHISSLTTLSTTLSYLERLVLDERLNFTRLLENPILDQDPSKANGNYALQGSSTNFPIKANGDINSNMSPDELVLETAHLAEKIRANKSLLIQEPDSTALKVYNLIVAGLNAHISGTEVVYDSLKKRLKK
jgi:hypothetical protein